MKSLIIASVAAASMVSAVPALAQTNGPTLTAPQAYVNLGYTYLNPYQRDLGELTGRLGLRFGRYLGAEAEIGGGVSGNTFTDAAGNHRNLSEGIQTTGFLVGYLPLMGDKLDLLARVGYGNTPLRVTGSDAKGNPLPEHSFAVADWAYGAGAQYMMDGKNGLRFDYTRRDFQAKGSDNPQDDDTYTVSYVHKF